MYSTYIYICFCFGKFQWLYTSRCTWDWTHLLANSDAISGASVGVFGMLTSTHFVSTAKSAFCLVGIWHGPEAVDWKKQEFETQKKLKQQEFVRAWICTVDWFQYWFGLLLVFALCVTAPNLLISLTIGELLSGYPIPSVCLCWKRVTLTLNQQEQGCL